MASALFQSFGFEIVKTMRNLMTLNIQDLERDVKNALKGAAKEVAKNMEEPTKTWQSEHRPKFGVVGPQVEGNDLVAFGGVLPGQGEQAQVYLWVTRGTVTKPGINIVPVRAPALIFYSPYSPSTTYRSFSSKTASTGDVRNRRQGVHHPGVKAREFEEAAAEIAQQTLHKNVRLAIAGLFTGGQEWVSW